MGMHGRHLLDHGAVWAARTFQARDRRARNLGRLQWTVIVSKDWVHAPMNGCYTIAPSSFTTGLPDSSAFDTPAPGRYEMLKNLRFSADVMRRFADACGTAEAYGCEIDYMTILQLDSELMQALEGLPANLRIHKPEDVTKFEKRGRMGAIMATSTLWHRLFVIHRPCILLSRSNPAKYSLSSTRTWYFAVQMLKLVRYDDSVIMKNVVSPLNDSCTPLTARSLPARWALTHLAAGVPVSDGPSGPRIDHTPVLLLRSTQRDRDHGSPRPRPVRHYRLQARRRRLHSQKPLLRPGSQS